MPDDDTKYPQDEEYKSAYLDKNLKISLSSVKKNFEDFSVLDDKVVFLQGWFKDSLKNPPFEKLAMLRLDGDMYSSTMIVLENLYDKLSAGGYCIIDDYGLPPLHKSCK